MLTTDHMFHSPHFDPLPAPYDFDHDPKGGGLAFAYFTRPTPLPSSSLITGGVILSSPLIRQTPAVAASSAIVRLGSFVGRVLPKLTMKVRQFHLFTSPLLNPNLPTGHVFSLSVLLPGWSGIQGTFTSFSGVAASSRLN